MLGQASISVVIPCYNHANVLRRTLEALKNQTQPPQSIIVVDDGSSDTPLEIVRDVFPSVLNIEAGSRAGKNDGVFYLRINTNHGAPAARNAGAAVSDSEFLLFLDADAVLVPDALETFVNILQEHPEAEYAYANHRWGRRLFRLRTFDPDMLKKSNYIHTSSLIRRAAFPGFDESLKKFQDWDLWLTMAENGKYGVWIDRELYRIEPRRRGEGISTWLPSFLHQIPWPIFGWMPKEIRRYQAAERVIRSKHQI